MERQDLVVIGGGTGGYIVATGALRFGLKVVLIEKDLRLGGSALHFGCIPSKTLLHVANVAHSIRHGAQYGLDSYLLDPDLKQINAHISKVVGNLERQEEQEAQYLFRQLGGRIIFGTAKFVDAHTVQVDDQIISSKKIVIAAGSTPILPEIFGLDNIGYITNTAVFSQTTIPEKLLIIGAKPAAVEFAQAYARLGAKVVVIARGEVLPQEDPELVGKLKDLLIQDGIEFYTNTKVVAAYMQNSNKVLDCIHDSGEKFAVVGTEVMVALGRKPNVAGLGLENADIVHSENGIVVSKKLRTNKRHIYALGDVIRSKYKLTHAAEYQANIILSNIVYRYPAKTRYKAFPYVIFTTPEYAHVGLTEQQAIQRYNSKVRVTRFDFKDLDSAVIQNSQRGMIKVITKRGKVVGATILGPQASNLIAEWALAINMGANINNVAATVHAYPTLAQINKRVANKHATRNLFSVFNRRVVSYLQRVFA